MPNVLAPAPLSSMRWNDAPATTRTSLNSTDIQIAAANPPAAPAAAGRGSAAARGRSGCARRRGDAATAKPTASLQKLLLVMAAALALAGLTVSAIVRIGRMRARRAMRRKRRAMWDSAKTKRRSPQPMFHDEDAGLRRTAGVSNPRVPQDRTRAPQSAHADLKNVHAHLKSGRAYPRSGRRACRKSGHARPRNGGTCRRIACPMIGAGAAGDGNAVPARPQRAELTEADAAAIFPAGAAACERTRSGRCGAHA